MGREIVTKFKEDYSTYNKLLKETKSIFDNVINITEVGNNANTLEKIEDLKHKTLKNNIELIINVKVSNNKFFQFKLKCKEYCKIPFFRFDSDGDTHRNYLENTTKLDAQKVEPPHFHFFNEDGLNLAYQTPQLENKNEKKALEDINLCIFHFFKEANIILSNDLLPIIKIKGNSLGLDFSNDDPNANMTFL
ncbi:hypothetical protein [Flavobacterium ovatum]|uniref:hypothetical protein n=1 Tax=Flavobacterium ovatum TaxID=1928857 RepID=UPI00344CFD99